VRWIGNASLGLLGTGIVQALLPVVPLGMAALAGERGWGLVPRLALPGWITFVLGVLALDLVFYAEHRAFHAVPLLWRLHRVHHADLEVDVTSGLRFHPVEALVLTTVNVAVVAGLGLPLGSVFVAEALGGAATSFGHANARLPARLDRALRLVLVTPDLHRVHHSVVPEESHSNFGTTLSVWDRIFGSYRVGPAGERDRMLFGIPGFQDARSLSVEWMLALPFLSARKA
jgi:sterol desaturase/sphingolipid hydroxylase (fatty acid hydroxylase superfamily)